MEFLDRYLKRFLKALWEHIADAVELCFVSSPPKLVGNLEIPTE